ncbi:hypothetical protein HMPREF1990_01445 [Porphyromonas gingivalis W4087]|uniref:Uncharacterized protein n=1 Tax=Porphyromonas gingivalis F0570 TaxID=1227271 RepID=A0A0E2LR08_PORGN|nr:hypothetical protein HMPREF1555_00962 [Porphyromonas gingivalis F0570]ERJ67445.1 hypothetical protein HMPREF1553_01394 [Porphyromonas gingivalis F0568]ERJ88197.1 hypothetical protein HMPREF1990_01445 [Porphyromonas gingivalis W4087]
MRNRFEERFVIVLQAKSGTPIYKLSEEYGYPRIGYRNGVASMNFKESEAPTKARIS